MSQQEIADLLKISRAKVSRILSICKKRTIVDIKINVSPLYYANLAKKIEEQYHQKKVIVVEPGKTDEESKNKIGEAAAQYFKSIIRSDMYIGMAWGSTILAMVMHFQKTEKFSGIKLLQLAGSVKSSSANLDGREMIKALALKINAEWHHLQYPYIVDSPSTKEMILRESEVKNHFAMFEKMNIAIVGVGSSVPEKTTMFQAGYLSCEQAKTLVDMGAAADIAGNRLSVDGRDINTFLDGRVITVPISCLKNTETVMGLAAGKERVLSLIAGIRGNILNTLILDEVAAICLLNF
jgi:DNA-binding transcriptional regulator LsrR (DeoR family)